MNKKLANVVVKAMDKKAEGEKIGDVSGEVVIEVVLKYDAETKGYRLFIGTESSSGEKHNIETTKEIGKIVEGYIEDQLHYEGLPIF